MKLYLRPQIYSTHCRKFNNNLNSLAKYFFFLLLKYFKDYYGVKFLLTIMSMGVKI